LTALCRTIFATVEPKATGFANVAVNEELELVVTLSDEPEPEEYEPDEILTTALVVEVSNSASAVELDGPYALSVKLDPVQPAGIFEIVNEEK